MAAERAFRVDPSATASFVALRDALPDLHERTSPRGGRVKAVVIGGGTGASVSIRTLLSLDVETSAVVAMADDGGSTGILREEADVTPPGDVRKCIAAFARDPRDPIVQAFRYRIAAARDHALGNLLLAALEDACGSFPEAVEICERLVDARGHVHPSTLDHVTLTARARDGRVLNSQDMACHSAVALEAVRLRGEDAGSVRAYPPALDAIRDADLIVLGPGSLFTSIIASLLVPGIVDAVRSSRGRVLFVCSVADTQGETWGLSAREHVQALVDHGMGGLIDYVLVHGVAPLAGGNAAARSEEGGIGGDLSGLERIRPVAVSYGDVAAIQSMGVEVIVRDLADPQHPTWHSPLALREAFACVLELACRGPEGD